MPTSRNQPSHFTLRRTRLCASFITAARWDLRRAPFGIRKAFSSLATAAGLVTVLSSVAVAQQFRDVTREVGLVLKAKHSWGNPIWGDINNDGFLDLIVPTHGLLRSHGPFVYLNNAGNTFTDIHATSGITRHVPLDAPDWHGFSFGDYDGDGNLDLYISIGATEGTLEKSDLLFRGLGDGTFEIVNQSAWIENSTHRGRCGFWVDYDNDGRLDLFVKNFEGANRLYRNNGDGTFTEVANAAGLESATSGTDEGFICSFADYDNAYTSIDFVWHRFCSTLGTIIPALNNPHQPSRRPSAKTATAKPNRILSPSFNSTSVIGTPLTCVPFVERKSCSR